MEKILALFEGEEKFNELPILDIGDKEGITGYIDFIQPDDMTSSIMRGIDKYGRSFFSIRAKVSFKDENENEIYEPIIRVQSFFQRYADNEDLWSSGGRIIIPTNILLEGNNINKFSYDLLQQLIKSGSCIFSFPQTEIFRTVTLV